MTLEEKQTYVNIIKKLYGDTIQANTDQINDEVVDIVESILEQVRTCTAKLGIFISIINGLAAGIQTSLEVAGITDPDEKIHVVEEALKSTSKKWIEKYTIKFGAAFVYGFVETWVDILVNDKQSLMCLNTAKLYWKSPLAIALLGL